MVQVGFQAYMLSMHQSYKMFMFDKQSFYHKLVFCMTPFHAYAQYTYIVSTKMYQIASVKALDRRLDSAGVKPSLVSTVAPDRFPVVACGRIVVASPRLVFFSGYSSFLHHIRPQNTNICAFENVFISPMSFLCDQSKIISV